MNFISQTSKIAIIILAGGSSSRLGKPKQLLIYQQQSLLQKVVNTALQIPNEAVIIVTGFLHQELVEELNDQPVSFIYNPDWEQGIGSSVKAGIKAISRLENDQINAVLFLLSDQPLITVNHLNKLVSQFYGDKRSIIAATAYAETQGVPAIFDKSLFTTLKDLPGNRGAQWIFNQHKDQLTIVPFEDAAIDIDTPEDYENLLKRSDL